MASRVRSKPQLLAAYARPSAKTTKPAMSVPLGWAFSSAFDCWELTCRPFVEKAEYRFLLILRDSISENTRIEGKLLQENSRPLEAPGFLKILLDDPRRYGAVQACQGHMRGIRALLGLVVNYSG